MQNENGLPDIEKKNTPPPSAISKVWKRPTFFKVSIELAQPFTYSIALKQQLYFYILGDLLPNTQVRQLSELAGCFPQLSPSPNIHIIIIWTKGILFILE